MICVIHSHGKSFAGLGQYVLHDKQADTSDRVAWSHTHNLATTNPELATRIMAATAMDNVALKEAAGIPATGNKLKSSVMHYSLSWHAEERADMTREAMIEAALASMTYVGVEEGDRLGKNKKTGKVIEATRTQFAAEHQAVIVCHDEGEGSEPHVHIMLNRVHPEHGAVLSDSNNFEKLSDWALDYRKAQGKEHYCPERLINAALREQGYRNSNKRKPRNVYEQEKEVQESGESEGRKAAILDAQRRKAAQIKAEHDRTKQLQKEAVHNVENALLAGEKQERDRAAEMLRKARNEALNAHKERLQQTAERQLSDLQHFEQAQETLKGRVSSTFEVFKTKEWMNEIRTSPLHAMTDAFKLAFDSGLQRQQLDSVHQQEKQRLDIERRQQQREDAKRLREEAHASIQERMSQFEVERQDTLFKQDMERAKMKSEWVQFREDRKASLQFEPPPIVEPQKSPDPEPETIKPVFDQAASPAPEPVKDTEADERERRIDEFKNSLQADFDRSGEMDKGFGDSWGEMDRDN